MMKSAMRSLFILFATLITLLATAAIVEFNGLSDAPIAAAIRIGVCFLTTAS